jgi:ATP-dependent DNA ligase
LLQCAALTGLPTFEKLRFRGNDQTVLRNAFDLLELDGTDLRREPLEVRKAKLTSLLRGCLPGVPFRTHARLAQVQEPRCAGSEA